MSPRAGYAIARGLYSRVFAIAYFSDLPECLLIEFFCEGINQPPMSKLITSQLIFLSPVTSQLIVMSQVKSCYVLSVAPRSSRSVLRYPRLASSLRDTPLVSERTAVIPKATYFNPPVPELIPLSEALPMMMDTTTELPKVMVSSAASPEVAAHAAETPEAHFSSLYGGCAQQCTLSLSCHGQRDCYYYRTSRGGSNHCRTFGGVSGIHSPNLCLSCRSQKGYP